jgi:tyrosinase
MTARQRRDVHSLPGTWPPLLRAYALAIGVMAELPPEDPRSLAYQAAVHGTDAIGKADGYLNECQHSSWYFIPWHRWYLYYFERMVRAVLREIPEVPADVADEWALPYWNYGKPGGETLRPEFAAPELWDGRPNPLHNETRNAGVNELTVVVAPQVRVPLPGVLDRPFSAPQTSIPTFGGPATGWNHGDEPSPQVAGGLEGTPHNGIHQYVGGDMMDFARAGFDPVFWLHHCNIDRYWEVRGHATDPLGWDGVAFGFRDADGSAQQVTADGCVDTVGQLEYAYDDVTRPEAATEGLRIREGRLEVFAEIAEFEIPPEVVGQSDGLRLDGAPIGTDVPLGRVSRLFAAARAGGTVPRHVYLMVNDIRWDADPGRDYGVYLQERTSSADDSRLAGVISFFGTRRGVDDHELSYSFDITDIVRALRETGDWDPDRVPLTFRPLDGSPVDQPTAPVQVGSVSVVYQ